MINHVAITRNVDMNIYAHERALKIVESIVDKICLFFSSIKARAKLYRSILCFVSSLLSYKFVNYTV